MLMLREQECHNINLVSASHVVAEILEALVIAAQSGLSLPLVWNTGGYDSIEALRLLDGVVDIYMPDMK
jgi:putative pyruvate formate lyase activating enzyme